MFAVGDRPTAKPVEPVPFKPLRRKGRVNRVPIIPFQYSGREVMPWIVLRHPTWKAMARRRSLKLFRRAKFNRKLARFVRKTCEKYGCLYDFSSSVVESLSIDYVQHCG